MYTKRTILYCIAKNRQSNLPFLFYGKLTVPRWLQLNINVSQMFEATDPDPGLNIRAYINTSNPDVVHGYNQLIEFAIGFQCRFGIPKLCQRIALRSTR